MESKCTSRVPRGLGTNDGWAEKVPYPGLTGSRGVQGGTLRFT